MSISSLKKFGIAGQWSLRNGLMGLTILAVLLFAASAHAVVQSSANFTMNSNVFDSGGGSASSANFQLNSSIGQSTPVGRAASANFGIISGYFPGSLVGAQKFLNDIVANLPSGVSVFFNDNSSSSVLHADTAQAVATGDVDNNGEDDVIVSFLAGSGPGGTGGTYISRNQGALVLLDSKIAVQVAVGDFNNNGQDDLLLDFGADNLWLGIDDIPPFLLIDLPLTALAAGDVDNNGQDDMIFSFTGIGSFVFKNLTTFDVLDGGVANVLSAGDVDGNGEDDVVASFPAGTGPGGTGGTFISRNQGALALLDSKTAERIAVGDFDNNGQEDLLLDFGTDNLWIALDEIPPFLLIDLPITALGAGDLDSNGQDDMIFSFTGLGTFTFKNLTTFDLLDAGVSLNLAAGNVDGN